MNEKKKKEKKKEKWILKIYEKKKDFHYTQEIRKSFIRKKKKF